MYPPNSPSVECAVCGTVSQFGANGEGTGVCVCVCVCVYVFTCLCFYFCVCLHLYVLYIHAFRCLCLNVLITIFFSSLCLCVSVSLCLYVCVCVCLSRVSQGCHSLSCTHPSLHPPPPLSLSPGNSEWCSYDALYMTHSCVTWIIYVRHASHMCAMTWTCKGSDSIDVYTCICVSIAMMMPHRVHIYIYIYINISLWYVPWIGRARAQIL